MDASNDPDQPGTTDRVRSPLFRVEHRTTATDRIVLARIRDVAPHHDTLTPFVSRLLRESDPALVQGELVLVDEETDQVLARRTLSRGLVPRRRSSPPPRSRRAS